MVHFIRNTLYRNTSCGESRDRVETAQSYTLVTCPDCLDAIIVWKTKELELIKLRRADIPKAKPKKPRKQMEIDFDQIGE